MIKLFKISGLRYITIYKTAEIFYFSTHTIPHRWDNCDQTQNTFFHTVKKIKNYNNNNIDYFKGLLMTHHLDIFMSGKKCGIERVKGNIKIMYIYYSDYNNENVI